MRVVHTITESKHIRLLGFALLALVSGCGTTPPARRPGPPPAPVAVPDLNAPSSARIHDQLKLLAANPGLCRSVLSKTRNLQIEPLKDWADAPQCAVTNSSRILEARIPLSRKVPLTCPMIAGYHLWVRESVEVSARRHFGQAVKSIETMGSYSCRNRNGQANAPVSEHASANALDVGGFILADGRRIRVVTDWSGPDPAARAFLHEVHAGACRYFSVVLGPAADAFHKDHFHMDFGRWRKCQ